MTLLRTRWLGRLPYGEAWDLQRAFHEGRATGRTEDDYLLLLEHPPVFTLGYGACFGHNEVKAISMAILDRALQKGMRDGPSNPSEDPEFVLLHVDGVDAMGFASHYKMPHYVTFQSDMDRLRTTRTQSQQQEPTHDRETTTP